MTHVPLLELRGLSAHAEGKEVPLLQSVSLTVPAGFVTAVVGPSGAGKTTLGLAALASSRSGVWLEGEVSLDGTELLELPESRRRALRSGVTGHLPQHPGSVLDPVRRIGGALAELAALQHAQRPERAAAARSALERSGLAEQEMYRRFPHQLSGGQQQRTALASALVTGAKLLVLDEPTSGLDSGGADALARTLSSLTQEGTGLLLLSHDLSLVRRLAAQVTVLENGRVVQQGSTEEVLGRTGIPSRLHPLTDGLLSAERRAHTGTSTVTATRSSPGAGDAKGTIAGVTATAVAVRRRTGNSPLTGPVTMSFPPGSRTALTGPSGAGKTTFGRLLAGLTRATTGNLAYAGAALPSRIERRSTAQLRAVQYVHQNTADSFEAHRPLLGQIAAAGLLLRGMTADAAEAEAHTLAERLGLDAGLLALPPGKLSGGQLQRCALARALMAHPALLVCDEVTSGLDMITREAVLGTLPGLLAPARTALLLISHDLAAVGQSAESVAVFEAGRCVRHEGLPDFLRSTRPGEPPAAPRSAPGQSIVRRKLPGHPLADARTVQVRGDPAQVEGPARSPRR